MNDEHRESAHRSSLIAHRSSCAGATSRWKSRTLAIGTIALLVIAVIAILGWKLRAEGVAKHELEQAVAAEQIARKAAEEEKVRAQENLALFMEQR
ncbi:MAG TPA: hypothetical protein VM733_18940, partial [Thermoanaerobaculia bacterium]|nr:hypothetical protein [Thermoanaerobaculia bacterium]